MTLYGANGGQLTKTAAAAKTSAVPVTDPVIKVNENLYEGVRPDGSAWPPAGRKLKFFEGQLIKQSELDALFPAAAITSITPATGAVAGGTNVTIRGKNFTPTAAANAVTFGGTNATNIKVVDDTTITCTTPAKTAGAVNVVVAADAGAVTATNGFTFA
ncbi:IPT/TIG domain-containing protein [Nonomuraea sp. NPDC005650]|uniref:IPT/TIG domain-containing protein n=1 Tax=Nonomuraea sp. NPDC005650 TaxID=3157045 RepID=UPI0033B93D12